MVKPEALRDTAVMTAHKESPELAAIYDEAVDLAFHAFTYPSEEHVKGVYERLLLNATWGLGSQGAVTIH